MDSVYDEKRITSITHEIAEAIELASFGKLSWNVAAEIFTSAFPGCCASLVNQDFVHNSINFLESVNIAEKFLSTYVEHFAYINPWVDVFARMQSGTVFVTEENLPSHAIVNTEFYNDWLLPQGDLLAGVGLKVDASPTDVIYFPVHYPNRCAGVYDRPAAEISRRVVGVLKRAIHTTNELQRAKDEVLARAALINRAWPALIVDPAMRLCGANPEAEDLLRRGRSLICTKDKVSFRNPAFSQRVTKAVADLAASAASEASSLGSHDLGEPVIVQLSRLPRTHSLNSNLISERPKILCVIKRLARQPASPDLAAFGEAFGLSRGELMLCLSLYAGRSLQEAAAELGITYGTVRDRAKVVFQKTGVRGQPGLCALLAHYSR